VVVLREVGHLFSYSESVPSTPSGSLAAPGNERGCARGVRRFPLRATLYSLLGLPPPERSEANARIGRR